LADTQERKRYHIHESVIQKAIKKAVNDARITKRATAHTLRHNPEYRIMPSCSQ
jgi:site-specific recombinase XerD